MNSAMKQDVEKHLCVAEETLREMEYLLGGGFYRAVTERAYHAMLNAAIAALLAKEIQSSARQAIVSEFNDSFVKTGLLDEKYHRYFSQAFNSRIEPDDPAFASVDYRQAQTNLLRVKEFIAACRKLCE
jgi:uncharacterized protein (UPF0332 family)